MVAPTGGRWYREPPGNPIRGTSGFAPMRGLAGPCDDVGVTAPTAEPAAGSPPWPVLHRRTAGRVIGGVAGGLADHLRQPVGYVRLGFAALGALGGAGIIAYALLWALTPPGDDEDPPTPSERRRGLALAIGTIPLAMLFGVIGVQRSPVLVIPAVVIGFGAVLLWREYDESLGEALRPRGGKAWTRVGLGGLCVIGGLVGVAAPGIDVASLGSSLVIVVVTLLGVGILSAPLWIRLWRGLEEERTARARAAEREAIAAHLHDSVLQTLALIQKRAEHPQEVSRLARMQERELRTWLFGGPGARAGAADGAAPEGFAAALAGVCAEVEDTHGLRVTPVVVGGDPPVGDALTAVLGAVREALVNVAKHAGVDSADVFAEVAGGAVTVFVRDRGCGFDPGTVPKDRHGLEQSVRRRVAARGGTVTIDSTVGMGTEVTVGMPLEEETT